MRIIDVVRNSRTSFLHASGSSLDLLLVVNPSLRALTRVEGITAQPYCRRDAYGGKDKDNLRSVSARGSYDCRQTSLIVLEPNTETVRLSATNGMPHCGEFSKSHHQTDGLHRAETYITDFNDGWIIYHCEQGNGSI